VFAAYPNLIKQSSKRFIWVQTLLLFVSVVLAALLPIPGGAPAAFCGGFSIWLANILCVLGMSRPVGPAQSRLHLKRFLRAHFVKWAVAAICLVQFFKMGVPAAGMFFGFLIVQGVYWFSPFIFKNR